MRFFISVNSEKGFAPNRYYKKGLEIEAEIPLYSLLCSGCPFSRDSYRLISRCIPLTESPASKTIESAVHKSPVTKNLFFVESNCAHNISYFTASIAAASLKAGQKLLIINFDQHSDHGKATDELLCSNWGGFARNDLTCDYLVIGEPSYFPKGVCSFYNADGIRKEVPVKSTADLLKQYDAYYVTVDMDILKNGTGLPQRTNWNDGILLKENLMEYMDIIPEGKVISADITGLPPYKTAEIDESEKYFTQYIADINEIAEKLESKLK